MSVEFGKPKIAIITIKNSYKYGGVYTCLKQVHEFCKKYFDVKVFCLNFDKEISTSLKAFKFFSEVREKSYDGMDFIEIGARWAFWESGHYYFTLEYWKKLLADYDYFFVVSGNCLPAYPLIKINKKFAMWIASPFYDDRKERIKNLTGFSSVINKINFPIMCKIERKILRKADFILALSKYTQDRFKQIEPEIENKMIICNYPVTSSWSQIIQEDFFIQKKQEKNIIAVGRFADPRKNLKMLLRVFRIIYHQNRQTKLFVVGSLPKEENFFSEFSKDISFKNIIFCGELDLQSLSRLYSKSTVLLLTSHQEGLGIVGLEAFLHKVPVVATNCGGTADFIIDGKNGYLVDINNDLDMAQKCLNILRSDKLALEMGDFARDFVKNNFSEQKIFSVFKIGLTKVYPELETIFNNVENKSFVDFEYKQKQVSIF